MGNSATAQLNPPWRHVACPTNSITNGALLLAARCSLRALPLELSWARHWRIVEWRPCHVFPPHEHRPVDRIAHWPLLERFKARHGTGVPVHVFPALPASLAVETGRVWMPKADPELRVYDQQRDKGFVYALTI